MALILNIDMATPSGSVCLSSDGIPLAERTHQEQKDHAAVIIPFVKELLQECQLDQKQIRAVAISGGPGSYTGLRVAASTAKGLCYALDIPLIAINTLEMMAGGMKTLLDDEPAGGDRPPVTDYYFCPMIDARRMEVFTALFDKDLRPVVQPEAVVLDEDFLTDYRHQPLVVFGTGSTKAEKLLSGRISWLFRDFTCKASDLALPAEKAYRQQQFQNLAYFEPVYLKPFYQPTGQKNI